MRESDIAKRVAAQARVTRRGTETAAEAGLASIGKALTRGADVAVRGFGWFSEGEPRGTFGPQPAHRGAQRHQRVEHGVVQGWQGAQVDVELTLAERRGARRVGGWPSAGRLATLAGQRTTGRLIEALPKGCDQLTVTPTDSGTPLYVQVPAPVMDGFTVVISPLVVLMRDQAAALGCAGVATDGILWGE